MNIPLSTPSLWELLLASFGSFLRDKYPIKPQTPKYLGKYKLAKKIFKKQYNFYGIGIYKKENKLYFAKTWKGMRIDFYYLQLVNEFLIGNFLYEKLKGNNLKRRIKLRFARPICYFATKNRFAIIFEYIKGEKLFDKSLNTQARVISQVLSDLENLSMSFTPQEHGFIPRRKLMFYLLSLPYLFITSIFRLKNDYRVLLSEFINCFILSRDVDKNILNLAHRDLTSENIMLRGKNIYLLDTGRMVLTIPGFDIAYLSLIPESNPVYSQIQKSLKNKVDEFLKRYISIQNASAIQPVTKNFYYLQNLKEFYARA